MAAKERKLGRNGFFTEWTTTGYNVVCVSDNQRLRQENGDLSENIQELSKSSVSPSLPGTL